MARTIDRRKRRTPCQMTGQGRRHTGLVINFSPSGLFIQTSAKAKPGDHFDLELPLSADEAPIVIQVEVTRKKAVPPQLLAVAQGGIGVRVLHAPEAYYQFVQELGVRGEAGTEASRRSVPKPSKHVSP